MLFSRSLPKNIDLDERLRITLERQIDPVTGVRFRWKEPGPWLRKLEKRVDPHSEYATSEEITPALHYLFQALDKYPPGLVRHRVWTVFLNRKMSFRGHISGGLALPRMITVSCIGEAKGAWIELTFHHELAHVLYRVRFVREYRAAWIACNSSATSYTGIEEYRRQRRFGFLPEPERVFLQGFVTPYGLVDEKEDFSTFAQCLMMDGAELWDWSRGYDRIRKKLEIIAAYYHSLDSRFTPEWFRQTGPPAHLEKGEPYTPFRV